MDGFGVRWQSLNLAAATASILSLKNLSDRHPESVFINIAGRDRL